MVLQRFKLATKGNHNTSTDKQCKKCTEAAWGAMFTSQLQARPESDPHSTPPPPHHQPVKYKRFQDAFFALLLRIYHLVFIQLSLKLSLPFRIIL